MLKYSALLALALFASPTLLVSSSIIDNNSVVQSSAIRKLQSAIHVAVDVTVTDEPLASVVHDRPTLPEWLASHRLNQGKHEGHNHESLEAEVDCASHGCSHKCHKSCVHSKGKTLDDDDKGGNGNPNGNSNDSPKKGYEVEIDESESQPEETSTPSSSEEIQIDPDNTPKERNQGVHEGHNHPSAEAELDCAGHGCDHHCHGGCIHYVQPVQVIPQPEVDPLIAPPVYVPPQLPTQIQGPKDVDGISMSATDSSSESSSSSSPSSSVDIPSGGSTFIALNQGDHEEHEHESVEAELDCASHGCSHKCHGGCCHSKGKCENGDPMMTKGGNKDHNFGYGKDDNNNKPNNNGGNGNQGKDDDDDDK